MRGNYRHGHSPTSGDTPTYNSWRGMIGRCTNPRHSRFAYYGARGITVCYRWLDFRNFLADMGIKPPGMTLGRIDNNFGYCKPNCQWETKKQQANNRRSSRLITLNGRTMTMAQWVEALGVSKSFIDNRLRAGWSVKAALETPVCRR